VGYIDPIHGPLDGPLYMGSHIHQHIRDRNMFISVQVFYLLCNCIEHVLS